MIYQRMHDFCMAKLKQSCILADRDRGGPGTLIDKGDFPYHVASFDDAQLSLTTAGLLRHRERTRFHDKQSSTLVALRDQDRTLRAAERLGDIYELLIRFWRQVFVKTPRYSFAPGRRTLDSPALWHYRTDQSVSDYPMARKHRQPLYIPFDSRSIAASTPTVSGDKGALSIVSSTELGERTVAQPLFAPSGPEWRAPLRTSENSGHEGHCNGGYTAVSTRAGTLPPRPHGVGNIERRSRTHIVPGGFRYSG